MPATGSEPRTREAASEAARSILEAGGPAAVTMRRVAAALGIQAPSLYKHYPDKRALEAAVIAVGLSDFGPPCRPDSPGAESRFGRWRGITGRGRSRTPTSTGSPTTDLCLVISFRPGSRKPWQLRWWQRFGDVTSTRVAWALAHGLVSLELADRFPPDADVDAAWAAAVRLLDPR